MANFESLLNVLKKELALHEDLLAAVSRERAAVVKLNQSDMERAREEKEAVMEEIRQLEVKRAEVVMSLGRQFTPDQIPPLQEILDRCPIVGVKKDLLKTAGDLRETAQQVKQLNGSNAELIKQTLGVIATGLSILRGGVGPMSETYSGKGSMRNDPPEAPAPRAARVIRA